MIEVRIESQKPHLPNIRKVRHPSTKRVIYCATAAQFGMEAKKTLCAVSSTFVPVQDR